MIVFTRTFLRCLVTALSNIDVSQLADDAKTNLTSLLGQKGRASLVSLTGDGLELGGKIYGILLTDKVPKLGGPGQPWCCIEISMKKSADDTLERDAALSQQRAASDSNLIQPVEPTPNSPEPSD